VRFPVRMGGADTRALLQKANQVRLSSPQGVRSGTSCPLFATNRRNAIPSIASVKVERRLRLGMLAG
jgi:hypothetical protein